MGSLVEVPPKKGGPAAFAAQGNGIDGDHIRHSGKTGEWTIDGEPVDGREERIVPFFDTLTVGAVKWGKYENGDAAIIDRRITLLDDLDEAPAGPGQIEEGWNAYTAFYGMRIVDLVGRSLRRPAPLFPVRSEQTPDAARLCPAQPAA